MTPEQLMQTRFEVIAAYPNMTEDVGDIWEFVAIEEEHYMYKNIRTQLACFTDVPLSVFPANFKLLQWWEKRSIEDMPEYGVVVAESINGNYWKGNVVKFGKDHFWNSNEFGLDKNGFVQSYGGIYIYVFNPATEQEYTDYINSKTTDK